MVIHRALQSPAVKKLGFWGCFARIPFFCGTAGFCPWAFDKCFVNKCFDNALGFWLLAFLSWLSRLQTPHPVSVSSRVLERQVFLWGFRARALLGRLVLSLKCECRCRWLRKVAKIASSLCHLSSREAPAADEDDDARRFARIVSILSCAPSWP